MTKGGTVAHFLKTTGNQWAADFQGLEPGSSEFTAKWKAIAKQQPKEFAEAQHEYIQATHYDVAAKGVERDLSLDLDQRSKVLRDVIWSTAVQHGPTNQIVQSALKGKSIAELSDEQIIRAIYAERGRKNAAGRLVYFSKNSLKVQQGVANRFENELADALARLEAETKAKAKQ